MNNWYLAALGNISGTVTADGVSYPLDPDGVSFYELPGQPAELSFMPENGKFGDSEDSFLFCYTRFDPRTENVELSASFLVEKAGESAGWQAGYGVLAADTAVSVRPVSRFRNHAAAGRFRTEDPYMYGDGLRIVAGYRSPDAVCFDPVRINDFSGLFPDEKHSYICEGEQRFFRLSKTGNELAVSAGSSVEESREIYFRGCDFILEQDPDAAYVGFAAAGTISVRVKEIRYSISGGSFSLTPPEELQRSCMNYPFINRRPYETEIQKPKWFLPKVLYASPDGSRKGWGTRRKPMDLQTAIDCAGRYTEIVLRDGIYRPEQPYIVRNRKNQSKTKETPGGCLRAEHPGQAVIDGSLFRETDPGMILSADDWILEGLVFKNCPASGLIVCGNRNVVRNCEAENNGDTGILICAAPGTPRESWPSGNRAERCESHHNRDRAGSNADGFGAKLMVGESNVFSECIAHDNIDDGFDLYSKALYGPTGAVVLEKCAAYRNGPDRAEFPVLSPEQEGAKENTGRPGQGFGFKMGGENQAVTHTARNCAAWMNSSKGFSGNSNPSVRMSDLVSWQNGNNPKRDEYQLNTGRDEKEAEWQTEDLYVLNEVKDIPERLPDGTIDWHGVFEKAREGADIWQKDPPDWKGGRKERCFLIDSESLDTVESALYGYMVTDDGRLYLDELPDDPDRISDTGIFSLVLKNGSHITVRQDFMGSFGLYLWQDNDRFLISNSFYRLAERLKGKLTVNRMASKALLYALNTPFLWQETLAREIRKLDALCELEIDAAGRLTVHEKQFPYFMKTVGDDAGDFELLDRWYLKWVRVFREAVSMRRPLTADLSGGLDTRVMLSMLINSGIDLSSIAFHTHSGVNYSKDTADLRIAREIAGDLGIELNRKDLFRFYNAGKFRPEDSYQAARIHTFGESITVKYNYVEYEEPVFTLKGLGSSVKGGIWKDADHAVFDKYRRGYLSRVIPQERLAEIDAGLSGPGCTEGDPELLRYYYSQSRLMLKDYPHTDDRAGSVIYQKLEMERMDMHKAIDWMSFNEIALSPFIDPMIVQFDNRLKNRSGWFSLEALIIDRYCGRLLDYEIQDRTLGEKLREQIKKLNKEYPLTVQFDFPPAVLKALPVRKRTVSKKELAEYLCGILESGSFREMIGEYYDPEVCSAVVRNTDLVKINSRPAQVNALFAVYELVKLL